MTRRLADAPAVTQMPSTTPPSRRESGESNESTIRSARAKARETDHKAYDSAIDAVTAAVADALDAHVAADAKLGIALSGGIDSMVLLDAAVRVARARRIRISAIHIHHGLSSNADRWERFCGAECAAREVPLTVLRLHIARKPGESLEALARAARYAHFMACAVDVIALAHHADDQAETVLLQLLRGAGPRGLSAMPPFRRGAPALLRPLLSLTRQTLAAYAKDRSLEWIEDESNVDTRHRRNLIRRDITPKFAAAFAGYPATLVRAASHQAEASALLDELAAIDAESAIDHAGLDRAHLAGLSTPRAANLLRWFLRHEGLRPPTEARLADMLRQLRNASSDARTRIAHDGAEIGCYRGRVVVHASTVPAFAVPWEGAAELYLPGGVLAFGAAESEGIAAAKLSQAAVTVRSREGGERIRLATNRPRHVVKKLLQRANLSTWQRQALPLVWCGDELVAIPGLGVDVAFQARAGERGWLLTWRPTRRSDD